MARLAAFLLGLLAAGTAPLVAQTRLEGQFHGALAVSSTVFAGGGIGAAVRPAGRSRLAVAGTLGSADGAFAGRIEAMVSYHVNPFARGGLSPYLLGGVAVQVAAGATREYLLVGIGVEGAPGSTRGMFAELGVAGGVRLALGWRVRTRVRPRGAGG